MSGEGRIGPGPGPTLGGGHGLDQLVDGVVIDGRYRVVRRLGRGGMAAVFEVADELLDGARRALKVLDPELTGGCGASAGESLVARFKREVILGQERLFHPNIVRVYGYGRVGEGAETLHYAVLELVAGETLCDWLEGQGEVEAETLWALLGQLAGVLAFAHERGVVHRDVKPSNIFVEATEGGGGGVRLRLGDFGIARVLDEATVEATSEGVPLTFFHCAPEQVTGGDVGAHTDVYLFGLVSYWLIHGGARRWDPTHSANPFPSEVGRGLAELVRLCLRSNGKDRPPDGRRLLRLINAARERGVAAHGAVRCLPEPEGTLTNAGFGWARLFGFGAALVLAIGVIGILIGKYGVVAGPKQVLEEPTKTNQPGLMTPQTATPTLTPTAARPTRTATLTPTYSKTATNTPTRSPTNTPTRAVTATETPAPASSRLPCEENLDRILARVQELFTQYEMDAAQVALKAVARDCRSVPSFRLYEALAENGILVITGPVPADDAERLTKAMISALIADRTLSAPHPFNEKGNPFGALYETARRQAPR